MKVRVSICSTPTCNYYYASSEIPHNDSLCPKCGNESRKPVTFVYSFYKAKGEK